jgi:protein involved in polysaccharide export with SLBB domain
MKQLIFLFLLTSVQFISAQNLPVNPASVDVNSLSDSQIQQISQQIKARGLSMEQAMELAKTQGASQTQIDQLMVRMNQTENSTSRSIEDQKNSYQIKPYTSPKAQIKVSPKVKKIFGYELFNSERLTFEPDVNIPIPHNYILGNGDLISISVWGASQSRYMLPVDKTGAVTIPDVGPVFIAGASFEQAKTTIKNSLKSIYSGMAGPNPNTWAEVSIGSVRSIKISVLGEINAPGTYTLPSTASAFNALYLSGGPNENGSFREIKIIRDGTNYKTIDVYDFLIKGDPSANVQLREQDILFIPPYQNRIEVTGQIKRSGFFEIKKGETISDLVHFSGGFTDKAYTNSLSILRNNTKEREVRSVNSENFKEFLLQNGDLVKVDSIMNRFSNRVSIEGAVFHPGDYEYTSGMQLSDLIKKADGLREDAFLSRGTIKRLKNDYSLESASFDLKAVLNGSYDLELKREDKVFINSIFQMREARTVSIQGEIMKPQNYEYQEKMTLSDLIFKAEGFKEFADLSAIEVSRRLNYEEAAKAGDQMNKIFQFALTRDLKLTPADSAFPLQPFDEVYVRRAPGFHDQGSFYITGEVTYGGVYKISNKNERISDAIKRAGGLIPGAFIAGATLTRTNQISANDLERKKEKKKLILEKDNTNNDTLLLNSLMDESSSYHVGIELDKIMKEPGSSLDLLLQPGDSLYIPRELQTVKVSGNVMNPLALTYKSGLSLKKYINLSGGYSNQAKKSKTYIIYANGNTATTRGFIFKYHPKVTPGSEIIVPGKLNKKESDNTLQWVSIASAISTLAVTMITLVNLVK